MGTLSFINSKCLAALVAALLAGCGPGGAPRYDLSGEVTFQGAPVQMGEISFDPIEPGVGGGFASIQNGTFDTSAEGGRGHSGGPHRVRIYGYEGTYDPANPGSGFSALFEDYETEVELPTSRSTMDFDVPAEAAGPDPQDYRGELVPPE